MSSKRFFLFDPVFSKLKKKKYLFFFKNASVLKNFREVLFKLNSVGIKIKKFYL
jgi:hypothetical protein